MEQAASRENYLKAIYILKMKKGSVRCVDLSGYMGFSKPSISIAVKKMQTAGYIAVAEDGSLLLTELGAREAEEIFSRHCYFEQLLLDAGVEEEQADRDACRLEHAISGQSFACLKNFLKTENDAG